MTARRNSLTVSLKFERIVIPAKGNFFSLERLPGRNTRIRSWINAGDKAERDLVSVDGLGLALLLQVCFYLDDVVRSAFKLRALFNKVSSGISREL